MVEPDSKHLYDHIFERGHGKAIYETSKSFKLLCIVYILMHKAIIYTPIKSICEQTIYTPWEVVAVMYVTILLSQVVHGKWLWWVVLCHIPWGSDHFIRMRRGNIYYVGQRTVASPVERVHDNPQQQPERNTEPCPNTSIQRQSNMTWELDHGKLFVVGD